MWSPRLKSQSLMSFFFLIAVLSLAINVSRSSINSSGKAFIDHGRDAGLTCKRGGVLLQLATHTNSMANVLYEDDVRAEDSRGGLSASALKDSVSASSGSMVAPLGSPQSLAISSVRGLEHQGRNQASISDPALIALIGMITTAILVPVAVLLWQAGKQPNSEPARIVSRDISIHAVTHEDRILSLMTEQKSAPRRLDRAILQIPRGGDVVAQVAEIRRRLAKARVRAPTGAEPSQGASLCDELKGASEGLTELYLKGTLESEPQEGLVHIEANGNSILSVCMSEQHNRQEAGMILGTATGVALAYLDTSQAYKDKDAPPTANGSPPGSGNLGGRCVTIQQAYLAKPYATVARMNGMGPGWFEVRRSVQPGHTGLGEVLLTVHALPGQKEGFEFLSPERYILGTATLQQGNAKVHFLRVSSQDTDVSLVLCSYLAAIKLS